MKSTQLLLKDQLFNATKVSQISLEIKDIYPTFDHINFVRDVIEKFPILELKERIYHIRDTLYIYLPNDYIEAVGILLGSLPKELDSSRGDDDFGDFIYAPYSEYISKYGCSDDRLDFSLDALMEITKRFSVEFAIREFINRYPNETMDMLHRCATSDHYHQRRLASESTRPKLPWAKRLEIDYHKSIYLLEYLYSDDRRYVARSVANHLNDISKIDPKLVIDILKRWIESGKQDPKEMEYIATYSLRTLAKNGDRDALTLLGYRGDIDIVVDNIYLSSREVYIGDLLEFWFEIEAIDDGKLMVDYIIEYRDLKRKIRPKVYKLKRLDLKCGDRVEISKKYNFRANMTTRKIYRGEYKLKIQINGMIYQERSFVIL